MEQNKEYGLLYKIFLLFSVVLIITLVFYLTFVLFGINFLKLMDIFSAFLISRLELLNLNSILFSFLKNALVIGFGSFISLLPIILVYYFFIALLEESFYLKKVLFVFERPLNKIGVSVSNILPLLNSFGCCVSALQSLNKIENLRERKISALAISFVTCSGKIPLCIALSMAYFPKFQWIVALSFYFIGILISFLIILLATPRIKTTKVEEIPSIKMPSLKVVSFLLVNKIKSFVVRVLPLFFICAILLWFLFSFDFKLHYSPDTINSIGGCFGRLLTSVFYKLEIYDWRVYSSFFAGFFFKENLESSLIFLIGGVENFNCVFSRITFAVFAILSLASTPCICVITELKRLFGNKFATLIVVLQYIIAWLLASAFFSFAMLVWKLYLFKAQNLFKVV